MNADWSEFYPNTKKKMTHNMLVPLGKCFKPFAWVDASWKREKLDMRSKTGFVILLNSAPIKLFSHKQSLIETSAIGAEFVAAKEAVDYLQSLR